MALSDLHAAKTLSELNLSETADQIEALRNLDSNGAVVEEYLAILSAKMDNGDSLDALCSTQSLLVLFVFLIIDYARCHDNLLSNPTQNVSITHRSYEYVLYILLGIAEKSTALRSLINYIEEDERLNLQSLFDSLGRIISSDTFYFTQVLLFLSLTVFSIMVLVILSFFFLGNGIGSFRQNMFPAFIKSSERAGSRSGSTIVASHQNSSH